MRQVVGWVVKNLVINPRYRNGAGAVYSSHTVAKALWEFRRESKRVLRDAFSIIAGIFSAAFGLIDPTAFVVMSSVKDTKGGMIKKRRLKD